MPKLTKTEYEEHGMSESLANKLNVEAKLREEADVLRLKRPKPVKKFTTQEVVDTMITDAVMLKEPFSRFINMQRVFLKQIQKEIEEKSRVYSVTLYDDENVIEPVKAVSLDWVDIIFRRYTE